MRYDDVLIWKAETRRVCLRSCVDCSWLSMYTTCVSDNRLPSSDIGTSLLSKVTKVAFRQTQVPIFRRNHATQQCRLEPLPEYNGQHYQSVCPGGNSYELHSECVRLVSGARRRSCSRCSASPSSVPPWQVCNCESWSYCGSDGVNNGRYVLTFRKNLLPPSG